MSALTAPNKSGTAQTGPDPSAEFVTALEAERLSTLSLKTLQRRQADGHDTGLRKHGRRIVFHVPTLRQFLNAATN
jgi:hypothetical protein